MSAATKPEPRPLHLNRRFVDRVTGTPTVLGASTQFTGDVRGKGTFVVYGEVQGDGDIQGSLNIASSARWQGHIRAEQAVVAGHLSGSLIVEGKLEIGYTAVIHGKVSAATVAIAQGAVVDGEVTTTSGAPVEQFEERREA